MGLFRMGRFRRLIATDALLWRTVRFRRLIATVVSSRRAAKILHHYGFDGGLQVNNRSGVR
jgi:hypothetical protein